MNQIIKENLDLFIDKSENDLILEKQREKGINKFFIIMKKLEKFISFDN